MKFRHGQNLSWYHGDRIRKVKVDQQTGDSLLVIGKSLASYWIKKSTVTEKIENSKNRDFPVLSSCDKCRREYLCPCDADGCEQRRQRYELHVGGKVPVWTWSKDGETSYCPHCKTAIID